MVSSVGVSFGSLLLLVSTFVPIGLPVSNLPTISYSSLLVLVWAYSTAQKSTVSLNYNSPGLPSALEPFCFVTLLGLYPGFTVAECLLSLLHLSDSDCHLLHLPANLLLPLP